MKSHSAQPHIFTALRWGGSLVCALALLGGMLWALHPAGKAPSATRVLEMRWSPWRQAGAASAPAARVPNRARRQPAPVAPPLPEVPHTAPELEPPPVPAVASLTMPRPTMQSEPRPTPSTMPAPPAHETQAEDALPATAQGVHPGTIAPEGDATPLVGSASLDAGFGPLQPIRPAYPRRAQRLSRAATVRVEVEVDPRGNVRQVRLLGPEDAWGFAGATRDAMAAARFSPPTVNGQPVRVLWRKTVHFRP